MTDSHSNRQRLILSLGVALLIIAVGVVAYLLGLSVARPAPQVVVPTDVLLAGAPMPTAEAPTSTHTATTTATSTPTSTATPTPTPTPSPTPELGTSNIYVEYILDASGSMNEKLSGGGLKLAVAKELLTGSLQAFLPETNVGLRVYGHRVYFQQRAKSCRDIELVAPVEKGQMEVIATWLGSFKAQGMTPLAESIRQAMEDFVFDPAHINSIVMLSDGIETCGGDPCGLVEELKAEGINFTIHVIGLQVDDPTREQLECIAQAGGGRYHDAKSEQDLAEALGAVQEEVTEDEVVVPFGMDTPTPVPPTDTPLPPTATSTPVPSPSATRVPPTAKPSGQGRIIFLAFADGHLDVHVMNPDGSGVKRLTSGILPDWSSNANAPCWSPDSKRIAFVSKASGDNRGEIYTMNADGSDVTRVTNHPGYDGHPSWSHDGKQIVFSSNDANSGTTIYVINVDGSGKTALADTQNTYQQPDWSPVAPRIAFASNLARTGSLEIFVMNSDGTGVTRLTHNSANDWTPDWSPDGKRIAFGSDMDGNFEIYVMNADGSGLTRLTNDPGQDGDPSWSADGKRIAFTSNREGFVVLYVMNADGSNVTRLRNSASYPDWSSK